ncbi:MAG TPA: putative toxin-antitoxin system toxin component, PIN family [Clostridia bacterium]|jgi:putative PIN family toxin of toxin-antitoxin system|nr:putative toxin-antitoxin system toxin component, PIN family [Clostridia bacterium]
MAYYAVIDTNVMVSAFLTRHNDSATVKVMLMVISGEIVPVYSNSILAEYKDVLSRSKFKIDDSAINMLISGFQQFGILIEPTQRGEILTDMKDLPFYEVVLDIKNDNGYLITGNLKHFPKKPFVVTASQFLEIVKSKK